MLNGSAGKGDSPRPTNYKQYEYNYERVFGATCKLNHIHDNECQKNRASKECTGQDTPANGGHR